MKARATVALAVIVGFGLGAGTVGVIHAQTKPPAFVIAENTVTNMDGYMKEYAPKIQAKIKEHGGRILAASADVTAFAGPRPSRVVVNQFESLDEAKAFYTSAEYKELRKIGDKYAKFRIFAVEGR